MKRSGQTLSNKQKDAFFRNNSSEEAAAHEPEVVCVFFCLFLTSAGSEVNWAQFLINRILRGGLIKSDYEGFSAEVSNICFLYIYGMRLHNFILSLESSNNFLPLVPSKFLNYLFTINCLTFLKCK